MLCIKVHLAYVRHLNFNWFSAVDITLKKTSTQNTSLAISGNVKRKWNVAAFIWKGNHVEIQQDEREN